MHYRLATLADVPQLAGMRWEFRTESGEVPVEDATAFRARCAAFMQAGFASGAWTHFVAEDAGVLAACMSIQVVHSMPRPSRQADRWGYLTNCFTRPSYRAAGVGSALLAYARAWAESKDLELLLVWPSEASTTFYERAGFRAPEGLVVLTLREYDAPPET